MKTLIVNNISNGTSTNSEAFSLYLELQKTARDNNSIILSFTNITFVSSSFLNSSIGQFIDEFGFNYFSKHIKFADCTPELAKRIKDYVVKYKSLVKN